MIRPQRGFLREDSREIIDYDAFRKQFGRDELIIIAINPNNVFDLNFLKKLNLFHHELKDNVPYIEDIVSLINARKTTGTEDELIVEDLLEVMPKNSEDLKKLKEFVLANPNYKNRLISEDGRFTTIVIKTQNYTSEYKDQNVPVEDDEGFEDDTENKAIEDTSGFPQFSMKENSKVVDKVEEISKKYLSDYFPIYIAGSSATVNALKNSMLKDMRKFFLSAIFFIALFLFIMFRRISCIILPLIIVVISLLSTVGLMAWTGTALKLPTQILPSFLLAEGVGDAVHILVIFFRHFDENDNKKDAIVYAIGHSGLAVFMTSLTTACGVSSFLAPAVAPIADLGMFATTGVMVALVYTLILLPAIPSIIPLKPKAVSGKADKETFID